MQQAPNLSRRTALLAGIALPAAALPGLAVAAPPPRHGAPAHPSGRQSQQSQQQKPEDMQSLGAPADTPLGPLDVGAKWALIVDYNSGATLLEKDADTPMVPSSLTKLMTLYIVYSMLKAGRLKLTDELPVSEKAWRMGGSKMFVQVGTTVAVQDLILGLVVDSGNDACIVLAEGIAGSEEGFVDLMNKQAKILGLKNATFRNCTGWPDPEHRMSCRDIATIARHIISDFPGYYRFDATKSFKYNNIDQLNRNPMVQHGTADGLKTGHTDEGGYGLCASSLRNGRRVILVLNGMTSSRQRSEEGERLMDWAFREFDDVTLFTAGDVVERAPVWLGTAQTVPLVGGKDLVVTMPRGWRQKAQVAVSYTAPVPAPVARGTAIGKLVVSGPGVPGLEVPLLAGADVPKLNPVGRAFAVLTHLITGG